MTMKPPAKNKAAAAEVFGTPRASGESRFQPSLHHTRLVFEIPRG